MPTLLVTGLVIAGTSASALALRVVRKQHSDGGEPLLAQRLTNDLDREISAEHARSQSFWP